MIGAIISEASASYLNSKYSQPQFNILAKSAEYDRRLRIHAKQLPHRVERADP